MSAAVRTKPDALQRPDIIGHQNFADPFHGERFDLRCREWRAIVVFKIAQINPPNTASAITTPPQLMPRCYSTSRRVSRIVKTIKTATAPT